MSNINEEYIVYKMYNIKGELLYIGKTTNFKNRMDQHFSKETIEKQPWKKNVYKIEYFNFKTRVDMDIIELYLIALEKPKYNIASTNTEKSTLNIKIEPINIRYMIRENTNKQINDLKISKTERDKIINNLNIYTGKLNLIGNKDPKTKESSLSRTWYMKANEKQIKKLKDNTYNYFRNICKNKSINCAWTCNTDIMESYAPRSYKKSYVPPHDELKRFNNVYSYAYLVNDFLTDYQRELINDDLITILYLIKVVKYITVDLNHELNLYVPSRRVRDLLCSWLNIDKIK